jgi:hypothetical protein
MKAVFITPEKTTFGFEPIMWLRSQEMIQTLCEMGVDVLPLEVNAFSELFRRNDVTELKKRVIIAPNFNYFLLAAADRLSTLDALEEPIIAVWDDPLGALANFVNRQPGVAAKFLNRVAQVSRIESLGKFARACADTLSHARRNFRRVMQHPLLRHFSWDTGHVETVESLGLLEAQRVTWYPIATYSAFLTKGTHVKDVVQDRDIGFCGNVYLELVRESEFFKNELLRELTTRICDQKLQALNRSVWSLMMEEIGKLPRGMRSDYGLYYDRQRFWDYYIFMVWHAANTLVRLGILGKVDRQVSLYGLFADPKSVDALKDYPKLRYEGVAHHFNDLPQIYASTKINLCISNGLVYNGIPSKLIDCVASGGFALCDPKEDLVRFFGPVVKRIFFHNAEELNSKIEYYLAHPLERGEIVAELSSKIRAHCTVKRLCEQMIEARDRNGRKVRRF